MNSASGGFCGRRSACGLRGGGETSDQFPETLVQRLPLSLPVRHVATINFPFKTTLRVFSFLVLTASPLPPPSQTLPQPTQVGSKNPSKRLQTGLEAHWCRSEAYVTAKGFVCPLPCGCPGVAPPQLTAAAPSPPHPSLSLWLRRHSHQTIRTASVTRHRCDYFSLHPTLPLPTISRCILWLQDKQLPVCFVDLPKKCHCLPKVLILRCTQK